MGLNLAKTPLLAVLFASMTTFAALLLSYLHSPLYTEASAEFVMPLSGYLMIIGYGLWISLAAALIFSTIKVNVVTIILLVFSFAGMQWAAPDLFMLMYGHPSGSMTFMDMLFSIGGNCLVTILTLVFCKLLLRSPISDTPKFKLKVVPLIIWVIVLPVIFLVLYFVTWYYFSWRYEIVREFYGYAGILDGGFMFFLIERLLHNLYMVTFALLQGFVFMALAFLLIIKLYHKYVMCIIVLVMLFLSPVLWQLIPSAVMPQEVRMAQLVQYGVQFMAYGVLCGVFLPGVLRKTATATAPNVKGAASAKGAAPDDESEEDSKDKKRKKGKKDKKGKKGAKDKKSEESNDEAQDKASANKKR